MPRTAWIPIASLCCLLFTQTARAALPGCDYWNRFELRELEDRLDRARNDYRSIPGPSQADLRAEYQRMWTYWQEQGLDPRRQMGDESWLRRVYMGRVYNERIGFIPTQEEFWIFCAGTRQGRMECRNLRGQSGKIAFDEKGVAVDPPTAFSQIYESRKDKFFEHTMLAAMIVDSLSSCDKSPEAAMLIDKSISYLREFMFGK
jgi:hypothetical protein